MSIKSAPYLHEKSASWCWCCSLSLSQIALIFVYYYDAKSAPNVMQICVNTTTAEIGANKGL